ncbi:MAG: Wzz/FepE/Etk N-terminal domain-containing protein [Chloroflexota bacterium]|nr:Wzz/FepE/Etk N-terminal domain-containing protein [Chloroflexota bacterium]
MSLIDYGRILLRRGWIIILLAALAGGSAYVFSGTQTPIYRATQLVLIQPSRNDLGLAEATIRLINSYVVYLNSTEIAQRVIDNLRLDLTAGNLKGAATIVPDRDRLTVQIDVDLSDPDVAGRAAEEWGNMLVQYRNRENQTVRQEDRINAILPDRPQIGLLRPNRVVTTAVGVLLGVLVGTVIVFALEYLESGIVRRREDIERMDIAVLASVPEGK